MLGDGGYVLCIPGRMEGWTDGWADGGMEGAVVGQTDGPSIDGHGRMDGQRDGWEADGVHKPWLLQVTQFGGADLTIPLLQPHPPPFPSEGLPSSQPSISSRAKALQQPGRGQLCPSLHPTSAVHTNAMLCSRLGGGHPGTECGRCPQRGHGAAGRVD